MKPSLKTGVIGKLTTQVGPGQTIALGGGDATVFSTPSMIHLMEHAAREALREHLEPGEESVGIDVQVNHSAATPPKSEVVAEAIVTKIEKNVVSFDIVASDPWGEIGRGTHRRAIIQTAKFAAKLADQKSVPTPVSNSESIDLPTLETLKVSLTDKVLRVELSRPHKRNAANQKMTSELESLVQWLSMQQENARVVVFSGAGGDFCAGDDVGDLPNSPEAARELSLRRGALYQNMTQLPQVLIAVIDGLALGGGLVFASACDFRIATHRSMLGLPEVTLGWLPNYGMGIVQSLIGRGRALELAVTGQPIDARRAESIGLVGQVVAAGQLNAAVNHLTKQAVDNSAVAIAATKRVLQPGKQWCDQRATDEFLCCLETEAARRSLAKFRR